MKKKGIVIGIIIAVLVIGIVILKLLGIIGNNNLIILGEKNIDNAISAALFASENGKYASGECRTEGHITLGKEVNEEQTIVYALTMYGEYGFQDNNFVKISGSGVIPAVIKLTKNDSGYILGLSKVEWPRDGADYTNSIKEMFPEKYHSRVLSISEADNQKLKEQEISYAKDYLDRIGREATIGEYKDFEHTLLISLGVSIDVSNKLVGKSYANYPYWIGTEEKIENGIRYVYERAYDKDNNEVIFKKYNYETKVVVEQITVDSITGEEKERIQPNNEESTVNKKIGFISEFNKRNGKFKFDEVEWITFEDKERIKELKIDANIDMPNGYYLYNPEENQISLKVDDSTIYSIINWSYKFGGERIYITNRVNEFKEYLDTYNSTTPPFWIEYEKDGSIKSITEQYVP